MEPTYTAIEEPITTMTEGCEAVISDILATQDPRELTLSETGERGPTPLEMRAGLPTGSFSPFDFEREFQTRHGVKPEDVDNSWHSYYSWRGSSMVAEVPDREIGPPRTKAPTPTSPTRGMEIIRTPGVTRDQECAEKRAYTKNIVTLDARYLQDIISGRWTRQQLYEPTPTWYHDSFYNVTSPWESQPREYEAPFGNQRSAPTFGYQSRLLPIGPPSDVMSTAEPPSMVGPLASVSETAIPWKKVDFSISHYAEETIRDSSQRDTQTKDMPATQIEDRPITVPRSTTAIVSTVDSSPQRETLGYDEGGQTHDITTLEVRDMDITTPDHDIYHGVYPDFQLPLPNRLCISDLFVGNTNLISNTNSPMSILRIPSLKKMYGTIEFAIGQTTGQLYTVGDIDVTPINLFGGIPDEDLNGKTTESTWLPPKTPQAMSTPITMVPGSTPPILMTQDSVLLPTPRLPITHWEERGTSTSSSTHSNPPTTSPLFNINRVNMGAASSVSSLEEGEGIVNDDEYERAVHRIEKINKKITILVRNWNEESKSAKTPTELIEIDEFYRPYMDQYNARWKTLERLMDIYVEYYKDVIPEETPQHQHSTEWVMPQPAPRTGGTSMKEKIERVTTEKRVQPFQESLSDET